MKNIAVIGGGASGIAAALEAAENGGRVTIFEQSGRIGHSVLTSGNGRCNYSNARVTARDYWNADFVAAAFAACPPARVWQWFAGLGLVSFEEDDGRLYPAANKSSSVLDVLRFALEDADVQVECHREVSRIAPERGGWVVEFAEGGWRAFDALVVACGGRLARGLLPPSYRLEPSSPILCGMHTHRGAVKGLDNVRVRATASLYSAHQGFRDSRAVVPTKVEQGEVQFRPYGISGIAVFNLSRVAAAGDTVALDLLPDVPEAALAADIGSRAQRFPERAVERALAGIALPQVLRAVLRLAGIDPAAKATALAGCGEQIARLFKCYPLPVEGFEAQNAQARRGGVAVDQMTPETMESLLDDGLYITGEALDVDGPCGGYNLHWAWTTGLLAGAAAAGGSRNA